MKHLQIGIIGMGSRGNEIYNELLAFPNVSTLIAAKDRWKSIIGRCDGMIISTNPDIHVPIALNILRKSVPVFIERPASLSFKELARLKPYDANVLVDHQYLFSSAYRWIKDDLGDEPITHMFIQSGNNGPIRKNYSALYDYSPDGLSICLDLMNKFPKRYEYHIIKKEFGANYVVSLDFDGVKCNMVIGNALHKEHKYFRIYTKNDCYIYNALAKNKLTKNGEVVEINSVQPLTIILASFLNMIRGLKNKRSGIDMSGKILKILNKIEVAK